MTSSVATRADRQHWSHEDWHLTRASSRALPDAAVAQLKGDGFAVLHGALSAARSVELAAAYDAAVVVADPSDVGYGRACVRVWDFVNRGPAFDDLYLVLPVLAACNRVIGAPFKLSTLHSRSVNPGVAEGALHVDFAREAQDRERDGWPMLGFIVMIDEFNADNGATRFVPGSHRCAQAPACVAADAGDCVSACGPAGSIVVYNGSVWHGHGRNRTDRSRRSIQGAYIRRNAQGFNLAARMRAETLSRIGPLAKYLLAI